VVNLEGDWYVLAKDERWGDVAQYAISRIQKANISTLSFTVPADFDADKLLKNRFGRNLHTGRSKTTLVRLLIDPKLANYVTEKIWHPKQKLVKKLGGGMELRIPVLSTRDIEPWILSLAENVKVLEPLDLRKKVQARHRAASRP
jgi:predicted DNA-binding transcriptional regulator YafY